MDDMMEKAFAMIKAQQPGKRNAVWMVGEQLKDIIRAQPGCAELIVHDLELKDMSLAACEKKLNAFAKANGGCVIPIESDRIVREFYGLPSLDDDQSAGDPDVIDLAAYF